LAEQRSNGYKTELQGIRAPLGVILYLIRRDNLDIYDIPIAKITNEYLEYLDLMEESRIELAGEFFVLAATLLRIKAQMLLMKDDETEEDPREGLVRSLIEYKKMMEVAKTFKDLEEERRNIYTRPVPEEEKSYREDPTVDLSLYQLMKAFREIIYQLDADEVRGIELEEYTIEEKLETIVGLLREREQLLFKELFQEKASRMELIVTLIALLELIKHAHVKVRQESAFGQIWIYWGDNFGQPIGAPDDWEAGPEEEPSSEEARKETSGAAWSTGDEPPVGTPDDFNTRRQTTVSEEENG
jgi:segregation and condensation protein A